MGRGWGGAQSGLMVLMVAGAVLNSGMIGGLL